MSEIDANRYLAAAAALPPDKLPGGGLHKLHVDAAAVTEGGASNPVAMTAMLKDMVQYLSRTGQPIKENVAAQLVLDQLNVIFFGANLAPIEAYAKNHILLMQTRGGLAT